MNLASPEFKDKEHIPSKFTCEGDDVNPRLTIEDIPAGTNSLALIVDDPDAPGKTWVHWVVYNVPVISRIDENSVPGKQGMNDFKRKAWGGPCPPSGVHRYFFKLYALDMDLGLDEGATKSEVEQAMTGHILEKAELVGLYRKRG
jgi:Raf kinase inhibitor-like YbhB/YbcL family protein